MLQSFSWGYLQLLPNKTSHYYLTIFMVLMGKKTQTVKAINCEKYDIKITLFIKPSNIMQFKKKKYTYSTS